MIVLLLVFGAGSASAGGLTLGLEGPLSTLATALSSGIASWVIYIGIAAGALMWAIGSRNEDGMKRVGQVVVGGTVAIKALPFMTELGLFGATL